MLVTLLVILDAASFFCLLWYWRINKQTMDDIRKIYDESIKEVRDVYERSLQEMSKRYEH